MNRGDDARIRVRRSFRVATAVAAASLLATSAEAFLCATDATGVSRLLNGTPRYRSSSRCALEHGSRGSSRASPHASNQESPSGGGGTSRRWRRRLPPSRGADSGVRPPRGVPPLRAAEASSDQLGDAAASAGGGKGWQPGPAGVGTELAGGRPREGVQPKSKGKGCGRRPFGHITDETLDLIRASTSITEVIGQHVEMQPAGRGMVGCCPFHEDRNPSFSVDESRGSYHCFGCGASGDVITFKMQIDGLGFREVVRELAEEAGVPLGFDNASDDSGGGGGGRWDNGDDKQRREARERLSLVLQMAAQFYNRCLVEMPAAGGARAHIIERGVSPMTVMDFQLGYSPADLTSPLIEYLDQEGFEMDTLVDAGLAPDTSKWKYPISSNNPRTRVDRFRGRLVVPIRDHRGLVIGFGARDLSDSQTQGSVGSGFVIPEVPTKGKTKGKGKGKRAGATGADSEVLAVAATGGSGKVASSAAGANGGSAVGGTTGGGSWRYEKKARPPAKYLNSPETTLFKKGKNVFGLDLAKEAIRSEDTAFVVEGYFDVIKLHDAGIRCAVGVLGTAITIDQLQLCARYSKSKRVVLCMDGDAAGQRAVERLCESPASSGLDSLSEAGVSVSVASIPAGSGCKDPADFLQAHGADEFRSQVMSKAVPWSNWYGDRILAEHDFEGDANAFRRCTDRLTGFISDLSIPTDQTFHVHRFARALAGGNEVMRHQLEFDLMNMSNEKRARKNALRRRVAGSPASPPARPPPSTPSSQPSSSLSDSTTEPYALDTPGGAGGAESSALAPAAELRRLASGRSSDNWDVVVDNGRPAAAAAAKGQRQQRAKGRGGGGGGGSGKAGRARAGGRGGLVGTGADKMEGVSVLRDHQWVMERVRRRKQEESRLKREKYGRKNSAIWSPYMEQEYGGGSEGSKATELVLRGRILDQAQRFLLALVVHDPSRRAKCAEEVSRHGLTLGGERRQWLFDAFTVSVATAAAPTAEAVAASAGEGGDVKATTDASPSSEPAGSGQQYLEEGPVGAGWGGPSAEALEVGGEVLFAEVRAAAPAGYFSLGGKAGGMGVRAAGAGAGEGEEEEGTLDWVFEKTEADRVAKGTKTDLVLLEVVMVMLKEQAAARMHALSLGLAETSDAIARTMAEAATAKFFSDPASTATSTSPPDVEGDERATAAAAVASGGADAGTGNVASVQGGGGTAAGGEVGARAGGGDGLVVAAGVGRRSGAEAQAEVERLKARQVELFEMIQEEKEEVAKLEAQRKAFTSRLPKVRAESEVIRNEAARSKNLMASAAKARATASTPTPPPPPPPAQSSAEYFHDERRQQQLQELKRGGGAADEGDAGGVEGEEGRELTLKDFPYRFLAEDQEPEEGINIYDVEANIAAARAAKVPAEGGTASPPVPPPPPQPLQQYHNAGSAGHQEAEGFVCRETLLAPAPRHSHPNNIDRPVPPPRPQTQQAATAAGGTVRAHANASPPRADAAAPGAGHGARGGAATRGVGGGNTSADARSERAAAAVGRTAWSTPSLFSEATAPAVTVMAGVGEAYGVDDEVMERAAKEAEEQTERMDEGDDVFDSALMGW
eukprot:g10926.t1